MQWKLSWKHGCLYNYYFFFTYSLKKNGRVKYKLHRTEAFNQSLELYFALSYGAVIYTKIFVQLISIHICEYRTAETQTHAKKVFNFFAFKSSVLVSYDLKKKWVQINTRVWWPLLPCIQNYFLRVKFTSSLSKS